MPFTLLKIYGSLKIRQLAPRQTAKSRQLVLIVSKPFYIKIKRSKEEGRSLPCAVLSTIVL